MSRPFLIDITGCSDIINLAHVRSLHLTQFGRDEDPLIRVELTFSDGSEDSYMVKADRWRVLQEIFYDLTVGV